MTLPPWIDLRPTDFLRAIQAGTSAGQAAADAAQRAWENDQRMRLEQQRIEAEQALRKQQQQGLQLWREAQIAAREQGLQQSAQRASELGDYRSSLLGQREQGLQQAAQREKELQESRTSSLDLRRQLADQAADLRKLGLGLRERDIERKEAGAPAKVTLEPQPGTDEQGTLVGSITDPAIQERLAGRKKRAESSTGGNNFKNMIRGMFGMPYVPEPGSTNAPTVAPEKVAPVSDLVEVTNPSGKRVRIKRDQLDDALAQGYKE